MWDNNVVLHDYYNYHDYLISYKPLMHVVAYTKFLTLILFIYLFIIFSMKINDIVYGQDNNIDLPKQKENKIRNRTKKLRNKYI